jgi:hypothetical protein
MLIGDNADNHTGLQRLAHNPQLFFTALLAAALRPHRHFAPFLRSALRPSYDYLSMPAPPSPTFGSNVGAYSVAAEGEDRLSLTDLWLQDTLPLMSNSGAVNAEGKAGASVTRVFSTRSPT